MLEPDAAGTLDVRFQADGVEALDATLLIFSDDPDEELVEVPMRAEGCEDEGGWNEDVIVMTASDRKTVRLFPSNGDGTFGTPTDVGAGLGATGSVLHGIITPADYDGDGDREFFVRDDGTTPALWRFDYDACTTNWIPTQVLGIDFTVLSVGDADGDGALDLHGWEGKGQDGVTYLNNGDNTFTRIDDAHPLDDIYSGQTAGLSRTARDVDGDGHVDLVGFEFIGSGTSNAGLYLFRGNGDGTYADPEKIAEHEQPVNGAELGDIDGDGDPDLMVGLDDDGDPGQTWIYWNDGGSFSDPEESVDVEPGKETTSSDCCGGRIGLYDWTGDGVLDATTSHYVKAGVSWTVLVYEGDGTASFGSQTTAISTADATTVLLGMPATR